MVRVVSRYFMARARSFTPQRGPNTFLVDLAVLMTDLARPHSVFVAEAKATCH